MKKLGKPPYRFTSEAIWRAVEKSKWTEVDAELKMMNVEGLIRPLNREWIRADRWTTTPPGKKAAPEKTDPRQRSFGFE